MCRTNCVGNVRNFYCIWKALWEQHLVRVWSSKVCAPIVAMHLHTAQICSQAKNPFHCQTTVFLFYRIASPFPEFLRQSQIGTGKEGQEYAMEIFLPF